MASVRSLLKVMLLLSGIVAAAGFGAVESSHGPSSALAWLGENHTLVRMADPAGTGYSELVVMALSFAFWTARSRRGGRAALTDLGVLTAICAWQWKAPILALLWPPPWSVLLALPALALLSTPSP